MPTAMSKTQIQRFIRVCEDQGIRITRTKKGLLVRFPDGSSTTQHFTNSDVRAEQNQIARFRRAGMVHPNDTRTQAEALPAYITSGTISDKTRRRIIDYVESKGFPEMLLSSNVVKDLNMDPGWANRALFHTGFRPGKAKSRKIGRPWYTPDEILSLKPEEETIETIEDIETKIPVTLVAPEPEATPVEPVENPDFVEAEPSHAVEEEHPVEDLEFIDTRDSWVPDMRVLLGDTLSGQVQERLSVLAAIGYDYEIRVWKK